MAGEKKLRKKWYFGFLGFLSLLGSQYFKTGNVWDLVWFVWVLWFVYFIPVKSKN